VDVETTGLNSDSDRIIELGIVCFEYSPETGHVYRVTDTYNALEDPGVPLSSEITAITGITVDMLAGQRIDDQKVKELVANASIVIAHNAAFDRPFLERRLPVFSALPFACSYAEVEWTAEGVASSKLEFIAYKFGFFYDAHRAVSDSRALLEILASPLPVTGVPVLKVLLDRLPTKVWTVFAIGSPFSSKDALKARGYSWNPDKKVWSLPLPAGEASKEEAAWLKESVYGGRSITIEFEGRDALLRYSTRPGKFVSREI